MTGIVESPTAPGSTEQVIPVSLPTCAAPGCHRRVEWRITGRDTSGGACCVVLACYDTAHRGSAAAAAWRQYETRTVEIRQMEQA